MESNAFSTYNMSQPSAPPEVEKIQQDAAEEKDGIKILSGDASLAE